MHIGLIGLGKMGGNMRERLRRAGHEVTGLRLQPGHRRRALASPTWSRRCPRRKVVWVMVPAGDPTKQTVAELAGLLGEGDLVIDGGNSKLHRRLRRTRRCSPRRASATSTAASPAASGAWTTATA